MSNKKGADSTPGSASAMCRCGHDYAKHAHAGIAEQGKTVYPPFQCLVCSCREFTPEAGVAPGAGQAMGHTEPEDPFNPDNLKANAALAATMWSGFCKKEGVQEGRAVEDWWGFKWAAYAMAALEALPRERALRASPSTSAETEPDYPHVGRPMTMREIMDAEDGGQQ